MNYISFVYLIVFIPLVLLAYKIMPKRYRGLVLLLASYAFFFMVSKKLVVYLMLSTVSIYFIGICLSSCKKNYLEKEKNADDLIVLIWATGEFKDDRFLKILHPLTNHRHSDIRRITYSAIRKISSPKSKFVLEKGLYDSNPQTRQYCAKALAKVGDDKTVEILQRLIEHKKLNEKEYVIRAYNEAILALKYLTAGGEAL